MTRQEAGRKRRKIRRTIRSVSGFLSMFAFLAMLGTAGSIELDRVPLLQGSVRMFGFLLIWIGLLSLAGAFNYQERRNANEVHRDTIAGTGRTGR